MRIEPFSPKAFGDVFVVPGPVPQSVLYLWSYLHDLGALAMAVEERYVDRHFLDDFTNYYARAFAVPSAHCDRIHFFTMSTPDLDAQLNVALTSTASEREEATTKINSAYLGFVVRRPLQNAPVGRSVLRTYPANGQRQYAVVRPYYVHILGLRFRVDGLAFQQQDGGAAVCASTALWSALQRVAVVAGNRTPTPWEVTTASGSPFPASHGLHDGEMAAAVAALGYVADRFDPGTNGALFRAKLGACLESHLPVILSLRRPHRGGVGHAVVVTGYAEARPTTIPQVLVTAAAPPVPMRAAAVTTLYVHDDNVGSHVHYELYDALEGVEPRVALLRGRSGGPSPSFIPNDEWVVDCALVPKPPKLRMPLENLFFLLSSFVQTLFPLALPPTMALHYAVRTTTGVDYRRDILAVGLDPLQMREFQDALVLPRHVSVLSAWEDDLLICDLLTDVTTIDRMADKGSLLGIVAPGVANRSPAWKHLQKFADTLAIPVITGPESPPPSP